MGKLTSVPIVIVIVLVSIFSLGIYILGAARYVSDLEPNTCDMTFMFEYPQYVDIKLDEETEKKYQQYSLYAYGEGYVTEKLRRMKFTGIPVLFIPGNAGSHGQVRSIASVSLRMGLKRRTRFHFDYFTVSLAEGLSALYGGILEEQTDFVSRCIRRVLSLYDGKVEQVVLIGHSMGGLVAKAALLQDSTSNSSLASLLINLASPHVPYIAFERTFADFYKSVNARAGRLKDLGVGVVVVGGGSRDLMVPSSQIVDPHADINVLSTGIPSVWRPLDHLSILWCKQFVIALNRALFDSVISDSKITSNSQRSLGALRYHLEQRYAGKLLEKYEERVNFEPSEWMEITVDNHTIDTWTRATKYLSISLNHTHLSHLSLDTINLDVRDWLFVCDKACKWGWNLTNRTRLTPDNHHRLRKSVDLDLGQILHLGMTHVVIRVPTDRTTQPVIHTDLYSRAYRSSHLDFHGPNWLPSYLAAIVATYQSAVFKFSPGTSRYFLDITGADDAIQFVVESISSPDNAPFGQVVVQVLEPVKPAVLRHFHTFDGRDIGKGRVIRMESDRSLEPETPVRIQISLDPRFAYEIRVNRAGVVYRVAGSVRDRWFRLYPVLIGLLILALTTRMDCNRYRASITALVTAVVSAVCEIYLEVFVSLGFLLVFSVATCCGVVFLGSLVHTVSARFLARTLAHFPSSWYDWLLRNGLEHLSVIAPAAAFALLIRGCAAVVILLSVVVYYMKLVRMYEDYLENLLMSSFRSVARALGKGKKKRAPRENDATPNIVNHLLMFMIWSLTAMSAVPSALVWAKNFNYETRLSTEDPLMFVSWAILSGWGSLGMVRVPSNRNSLCSQSFTLLARFFGWIILIIAGSRHPADYQWIIPPIVAIFVSVVVALDVFTSIPIQITNKSKEICDVNSEKVVK